MKGAPYDGSHLPSHQWLTLQALWPLLRPGGHYAIEDMETSYWSRKAAVYGYPMREERSLYPRIFELVHTDVNSELSRRPSVLPNLTSVQFGHNLIILKKAGKDDLKFNRRKYPWQGLLPSHERDQLPGSTALC